MIWMLYAAGAWLLVALLLGLVVGGAVAIAERTSTGPGAGLTPADGRALEPRTSSRVPAR